MAIVTTDDRHYAAIAAAIRAKSGAQTQYRPEQMAPAIGAMPGAEGEDALVSRPASLTEYANDRVAEIGGYAFYANQTLQRVSFGAVEYIKSGAFWQCAKLVQAQLPVLARTESNIFRDCKELEIIDLPAVCSLNGNGHFLGCTKLKAVILRANSVCTLGNTNSFQSTPVASGAGYIYVPDALAEQYRAATNWVVYADQIRGISQIPGEVQEWLLSHKQ